MSRSIHTTHRTLSDLTKAAAERPALKDRIEKALEEKRRKRLTKRSVKRERRREGKLPDTTPIETVHIDVMDEKPFVVHGASIDDLRAVLSRLPHAARAGISRIQLTLGTEDQEEVVLTRKDQEHICDPIYGRPGGEMFPGVYTGVFLGVYRRLTGTISIDGFVVDASKVCMPLPELNLYLKMHALRTFVHEVAHHHDHTARVRRGRWLADNEDKVESYAQKMEEEWTGSVIMPFLEKAYPAETEAFLKWVEHWGGIRLKLAFFAGDPRQSKPYGRYRYVFSPTSALESWIAKIRRDSDLLDYHVGFARELHYADYYDECLTILNGILRSDPKHLDALTWKADTLVHLEKWLEADEIIAVVLQEDPVREQALEVRGQILEERKNWEAVLENCRVHLSVTADPLERRSALMREAVAYCALGQEMKVEERIEEVVRNGWKISMNNPARVRMAIYRRAGLE